MKASILVFGETGNGKSSLCNQILEEKGAFTVSDKAESETKQTIGKYNKAKNVFVIDTPGLQDTQGADKEHLMQMIEYVKEHKELQAVVIVFNCQQCRFPYNIQTMLKLFCNIFPMEDFYDHLAIVFSKAYTRKGALKQEQKDKILSEIWPVFKKVVQEASGVETKRDPPTFFVDIAPDEVESETTLEVNRLTAWASSLDPIDTANKVKEKLYAEEDEEFQDFTNEKIDGDYIIKTVEKKKRMRRVGINGDISYSEWEVVNTNTEKKENPLKKKLEEIQKKDEEAMNKLREEMKNHNNKELRAEMERIREKMESDKRNYENMLNQRLMQEEENRRRKQSEESKKKYCDSKLNALKKLIENAKGASERKKGEFGENQKQFSAGYISRGGFIEEAELSDEQSKFKTEGRLFSFNNWQDKIVENSFADKIIVGWMVSSDEDTGYFERLDNVCGTDHYRFKFTSGFKKNVSIKLRIWVCPKELSFDDYDDM